MNILPYLVLGQLILTIIVHVFITLPSVYMLFKYYLNDTYSLVLKLFLTYLVVFGFAAIINSVYLLIYWSPDGSIYNLQTLCLFGSISWGLQFGLYNFEFFLCFERCCVIVLKFRYTKSFKKYFGITALFGTATFAIVGFWADQLPIISPSVPTSCQFYGCVLDKTTTVIYIRIFCVINTSTNIICTITLLFLIKIVFKNQKIKEIPLYKSVIISIFISSCMQWFPNAFSSISYLFLTTPITEILGPVRITIISLNVSLNSFIYFQTFRSSSQRHNRVVAISINT